MPDDWSRGHGGIDPSCLESLESLEHRRILAMSQLDAFIDVCSAWRGHYKDDEWIAWREWISAVIGRTSDYTEGGHLVNKQNEPALAWKVEDGRWLFGSLDKSYTWPMTRLQFRKLSQRNGVSLPSRHATLWIAEMPAKRQEIVDRISVIRMLWTHFKELFPRRRESNDLYAAVHRNLHSLKLYRNDLSERIKRLPAD